MNKAEVSVVIPAYNCAKTIVQAVESVLLQQENTEIIIVDDHSSDELQQVLERYINDGRVRYVRNKENMGVAASRNYGVSIAKGTYIAFLDADDWWEPGKLSTQLQVIKESGTVLCCTGRRLCSHSGEKKQKVIGVKKSITYRELLRHNIISCSSVLLDADVAREFPMAHDECHEDYICWLQILKKYGSACGIDQPLLNYRLSDGGKSRNKLKSAKMTYQVYRLAGLNIFQRIICFTSYMIHGVLKYL